MKVIDILNKIANGEEVPQEIKYRNIIFVYDKVCMIYLDKRNDNEKYNDLLIELSNHKGSSLNDEVEILEEDKKIEKIKTNHSVSTNKNYMEVNDKQNYVIREVDKLLIDKINEVIDYINKEEK